MTVDNIHRYAVCVVCNQTFDVRTEAFSNHSHQDKFREIEDEHLCSELLDSNDKIRKSKASDDWYLELDEGFNMRVKYCHLCGEELK